MTARGQKQTHLHHIFGKRRGIGSLAASRSLARCCGIAGLWSIAGFWGIAGFWSIAVWCGFAVWSTPVHAEPAPSPAAMCVTQAERAQEFYQSGDVAQARAEVALCAQAHCPPLVRNDCESWLHEWDRPTPSNRRLPAESDNADTTSPISDPIAHDAHEPLVTESPTPARPARASGAPIWPWFVSGLAAAGGVGFAYWGLNGRREAEALADTCGRTKSCRQLEVDPVRNKLIFADLSLGVGLVACGVAIWGFATGGDQTADPEHGNAGQRASTARTKATLELHGSSITARFVF